MEVLVLNVLVTIAGAYFFVRNVGYLRNPDKLESYLATSPKAKMWVSKFGQEKTADLTRRYFLPLGIVVAAALLILGFRNLYVLLPAYM